MHSALHDLSTRRPDTLGRAAAEAAFPKAKTAPSVRNILRHPKVSLSVDSTGFFEKIGAFSPHRLFYVVIREVCVDFFQY